MDNWVETLVFSESRKCIVGLSLTSDIMGLHVYLGLTDDNMVKCFIIQILVRGPV